MDRAHAARSSGLGLHRLRLPPPTAIHRGMTAAAAGELLPQQHLWPPGHESCGPWLSYLRILSGI
uniref:Uncharacterized protein n=1 Tax=Arundo donax TaxID=35708 RepID=A0A0A8ZGD2_ARUDO